MSVNGQAVPSISLARSSTGRSLKSKIIMLSQFPVYLLFAEDYGLNIHRSSFGEPLCAAFH